MRQSNVPKNEEGSDQRACLFEGAARRTIVEIEALYLSALSLTEPRVCLVENS